LVAPQDSENCGRNFAKRTQSLREIAYYAWLLLTYIVINTLLGTVTQHPAGMHCPSWDDAFVSSLTYMAEFNMITHLVFLSFSCLSAFYLLSQRSCFQLIVSQHMTGEPFLDWLTVDCDEYQHQYLENA